MKNSLNTKFIPITLTSVAIDEVKYIMANKNIPAEYGLRIGVRGTGCSGSTSFLLGFDKPKPLDDCYIVDGIPIYIEKKHTMYLIGLQVDFQETSEGRGFTFVNPEAK